MFCFEENKGQNGFSLVEVVLAAMVMVVLCIAALSAFSYASSVNRGNNLRSQSLSTLQEQIEIYRGLKFKRSGQDPVAAALFAGTYDKGEVAAADGESDYRVTVNIRNIPNPPSTTIPSETSVTVKEITVTATLVGDEGKWFGGSTSITMLRVRAN